MDLDELRWFVVLAETQHVTDAAAELRVTQPTLSRALSRLEHEVGTTLFDRVNRRLQLNAYGQILLEHARRSIAEIDAAGERIATLRDPDSGTIRLAFLHSLASWLVPDLLRRFRIEAPNVVFDLYQGAAHEISEHVLRGRVDLAITSPQPDGAEFGWHQLYAERLCLAVPRGHRFATRARLRLAETADEPFIALRDEFGLRQLTNELWSDAGHPTTRGVRGDGDSDDGGPGRRRVRGGGRSGATARAWRADVRLHPAVAYRRQAPRRRGLAARPGTPLPPPTGSPPSSRQATNRTNHAQTA